MPVLLFAAQAFVAPLIALAGMLAFLVAGAELLCSLSEATDNRDDIGRQRAHFNAVHRAGRYAEVAAGAFIDNHGVHQLGGAKNGIDRAGLNAFGAADAFGLANIGHLRRGLAAIGIQLQYGNPEQTGQCSDGLGPARRALVDSFALGNALRIGFAARVAAFSALSLRQ